MHLFPSANHCKGLVAHCICKFIINHPPSQSCHLNQWQSFPLLHLLCQHTALISSFSFIICSCSLSTLTIRHIEHPVLPPNLHIPEDLVRPLKLCDTSILMYTHGHQCALAIPMLGCYESAQWHWQSSSSSCWHVIVWRDGWHRSSRASWALASHIFSSRYGRVTWQNWWWVCGSVGLYICKGHRIYK